MLTVMYYHYISDGREAIGSAFGPFEFTLACNISFFCLFASFFVATYTKTASDNKGAKRD